MCKHTNNNNIKNNNNDDDTNAHITGAEVCIFIIVSTFYFMFQFIFIGAISKLTGCKRLSFLFFRLTIAHEHWIDI